MKLNLQLFASGTIEFSKKTGDANWKWIQAKVVYSESNTRLDNGVPKSDVTVSLYGRVGTGGTSGRKWIGYVSIDGTKVIDFNDMGSSWADKAIKDTYVLYKSATTTVTHNSDGSKNITIAGGLTGPTGTSIAGLKSSGSSTISLDTIPTAPILSLSSASSTLNTLSFTVANTIAGGMTNYEVARVSDGTVVKSGSLSSVTSASITLTGQSVNTNYSGVYKIRCYANGLWGNWLTLTSTNLKTAALPTISNVTNYASGNIPTISLSSMTYVHKYKVKVYKNSDSTLIATSGDFTSLSSALSFLSNYEDTILSYIPNNVSITLKYEVIITYNSIEYNIGNKTATYNIQTSHYNPIFSATNIAYEDTNSTTLFLTGDSSKIIKGFSAVKFTISPMTAQKSATGKSYNISTGNRNTSINYSSSSINTTINGVDGRTYTIQAVDSRDKNTQISGNYSSYVDYSSPTINSHNINRLNGVGQNLNISFSGTFYNWSGLSVNNSIQSIVWKYRRTNTSTWTDGGTISSATYSGNTFAVSNYSTSGDLFNTSYDYYIRISVTDRLTTEDYDYYIPSGKPLVWKDLLNKRIGINKKPDYTFDVDGTIRATGDMLVNGYVSKLKRNSGGSWIAGRDNATVAQTRQTSGEGTSWNPVCSIKTGVGNWTIGNVGGERLAFSYDTDANYNAGTNQSSVYYIGTDGKFTGSANSANTANTATTASSASKTTGTLTIQRNGSNITTFNGSSNQTANISVPTVVSALTNDSGYLTSNYASHGNYTNKIRFSNGFTVVSGVTSVNSSSWVTISYGVTFSSSPATVCTMVTSSSGTSLIKLKDRSTTGCSAILGGSGISSATCMWVAIGHTNSI